MTRREAHCLEWEQLHLQRQKGRAVGDADLTLEEHLRFELKQGLANKHIYRATHNDIAR